MIAEGNIGCHGNIVVNLDVLGVDGNNAGLKEKVFAHFCEDVMTNDVLGSLFCVADKSNSETLFEGGCSCERAPFNDFVLQAFFH